MKNLTAKKRTKGAVNRVLAANKTLKNTMLKLSAEDQGQVIKAMEAGLKDLVSFVNAQSTVPGAFDFSENTTDGQ